jgi:hypothetical protein
MFALAYAMNMSMQIANVARNCSVRTTDEVRRLRRNAYLLAARTAKDPRTCLRFLRFGARAIRGAADQLLLADAARELGLALPP